MNGAAVAYGIDKAHNEISILRYNDKNVDGAISQIKSRQYVEALKDYKGNLLLVGINYDKKTKEHLCEIEEWKL